MTPPVVFFEGVYAPITTASGYTAPATPNLQYRINQLTFSNSGATSETITVYLIPAGQAAGDQYVCGPKAKALAAGEAISWHWLIGQHLKSGDMLFMVASTASKITARGSGVALPTN